MYDLKVIDNFLEEPEFQKLFSEMSSPFFPWYYQENISADHSASRLNDYGFAHVIYSEDKINSNYYETLIPIIEKIKAVTNTSKILKIRGDLTVYSKEAHIHQVHKDSLDEHIVSILYLTTTTSETIIFENTSPDEPFKELTRIYPKKNRLVTFNGKYYHTGKSPSDCNARILLNFNSI
jgi:hypothetical protein